MEESAWSAKLAEEQNRNRVALNQKKKKQEKTYAIPERAFITTLTV